MRSGRKKRWVISEWLWEDDLAVPENENSKHVAFNKSFF